MHCDLSPFDINVLACFGAQSLLHIANEYKKWLSEVRINKCATDRIGLFVQFCMHFCNNNFIWILLILASHIPYKVLQYKFAI